MSEVTSVSLMPLRARAVLATVIVVAVVGFIVLAQLLRVEPAYAGLLFFWYWAAIREAKFSAMPGVLIGSILGVGTAWLLQAATASHQGMAIIAVLLLIVAAIYVQVMELAPGAVNVPYMLFLTVAAAPLLQSDEVMSTMLVSVALAALYFGAIVGVVRALQARSGKAA